MGMSTPPYPNFRRMRVYVDGENLTLRFQSMRKKGYVPKPETAANHILDTFVWAAATVNNRHHVVDRATYYTAIRGDADALNELRMKIKKQTFLCDPMTRNFPSFLTPQVFHRDKNGRSKGVDIALCVEVLAHVHRRNVDAILLVAGDGDYEPLIREVLHSGCQVYLAFLSDGLNDNLLPIVDSFYNLDGVYFEPKS